MIQPDEIIRSNRKTLSISIDPFGRLIVRAPRSCGKERIFAFLQEKQDWILRKKSERTGAGICLPPENLNGYEFLLLGKKRKIILLDTQKVGFDETTDTIYLPENGARERLVRWLKDNAKRILQTVTERNAERMGATFRKITVTSARGRWGSCSYDNSLHYSFRLLYVPKEVIDYVTVHELAHTKHKNHSRAFWAEVEKYVPDWREKRDWLKRHAALMQVF